MPALLFVVIFWVVFLVDAFIPGFTFNSFGLRPRSAGGLLGIFVSPFLHGNLIHIVSNTIPLLVLPFLAGLAMTSRDVVVILVLGALGSGIGTWLFGFNGIVVGASGVVFAMIGFLMANAYFSPSIKSILLAGASFVLYGGALLSLLKVMPYISWAGHFWGFISGVVIAYGFKQSQPYVKK